MDAVWTIIGWVMPVLLAYSVIAVPWNFLLYLEARSKVVVPTGEYVQEYASSIRGLKSSIFYLVTGIPLYWAMLAWGYIEFPYW